MLKDPNAILLITPLNENKPASEFYKPFAEIICSENVLDYKENEYLIYSEEGESNKELYIVTDYAIYEATKTDKTIIITEKLIHNIGYLPAFIIGGMPVKISKQKNLYDSFISAMLPELDAAAQDISDMQAEKVQHVFSTMWYYSGQECNKCHGTGSVTSKGKPVICPDCEGVGVLRKSPYKDMMIKQSDGLETTKQMPTPPAGYITKPTEMVKLMDDIIKGDIYNAMSAINMEFLAEAPLNQSGKAKEVDRDELNTFVYGIAKHLVDNIIKPIYFFINEWRYKDYIGNPNERQKMLPTINVPKTFDLLTENIVGKQYEQAVKSKFSDEVIGNIEMDMFQSVLATIPKFYKGFRQRENLTHS
jgi:hypothetical protein